METMFKTGLTSVVVVLIAGSTQASSVPEDHQWEWEFQFRNMGYGRVVKDTERLPYFRTGKSKLERNRQLLKNDENFLGLPERLDEDGLLDQQAKFWSNDRDQVDVVLRRTDALLKYWLKKQSASRVWLSFQEQLDRLKERAAATQPDQAGKDKDRHSVYIDLCALRRRIVLANPLLDFDDLVLRRSAMRGIVSPESGCRN